MVHRDAISRRFKLRLAVRQEGERVVLELGRDPRRLDAPTSELLLDRFITLLEAATAAPERPVAGLPVLATREDTLLRQLNETAVERPHLDLFATFAARAAAAGERPAVRLGEVELTYGELYREAAVLGGELRRRGVAPEVPVVLVFERSVATVTALLAVAAAGGAWVPIDPDQPRERRARLMADVFAGPGPRIVLTLERLRDVVAEAAPEDAVILAVDGSIDGSPLEPKPVPPESLAYVLYTSGSTGRPKGVLVRRAAVSNLFHALDGTVYAGLDGPLTVAVNAPSSFDASIKQVLRLLAGDTLEIVPEAIRPEGEVLLDWLRERQIEVLDLTPAQLDLLVDAGLTERPPAALRRVLVGGEALRRELAERLLELPEVAAWNVYGPTECTVDTTVHRLEAEDGPPPVGRPLSNVRAWVVDADLELCPLAFPGELAVAGAGLARGYLEDPAATAEKFVPDPFSSVPGERLYRTGDRVRQRSGGAIAEGVIDYLGRLDHQVKLRGYRIELGEIEAVLEGHPGVARAVATVGEAPRRLLAYVVPAGERADEILADDILGDHSRFRLPDGRVVAQMNPNETAYLYEEIVTKESYTRHGVRLPEDAMIFDVGANIGMFSLFAIQRCPSARIVAFEPLPAIRGALEKNAVLHAPGAVEILPHGLGAADGEVELTFYRRYTMMSGQRDYARPEEEVEVIKRFLENEGEEELRERADELLEGRFEGETVTCRLRRLTDVRRELGVLRIDLLKIDVQRAEKDVLEGIDADDWALIDQVVMEVHDDRGAGGGDDGGEASASTAGRLAEVRALLEGHGFEVAVEQDELLVGTDRYNLYAVHPRAREAAPEPEGKPEGKKLPTAAAPETLDGDDLRDHLRRHLPEPMVPAAVLVLPELPVDRRGKVDRRALPPPEEVETARRGGEPPRTSFEAALAGIWRELLGVEEVVREDDFFSLGGHSLLATRLMSRVREVFRAEVPLRAVFEHPTLAGFAARLEAARRGDAAPELPPIEALPRIPEDDGGEVELPLSFAQERLWFLERLAPGRPLYNCPHRLEVRGELDVAAFAAALTALARRHEVLRTRFATRDGVPVQRIAPEPPPCLTVVDLEALAEASLDTVLDTVLDTSAESVVAREAARPFDLERGPLLRVTLLRRGREASTILFNLHHAVADAWSMEILVRETAASYAAARAGAPVDLPALPVQVGDVAAWQREALQGEALDALVDAWRERLAGAVTHLELPLDRPRREPPSFSGGRIELAIDDRLAADVQAQARQAGTLFLVVAASWIAWLARLTGETAPTLGYPVAGRHRLELEPLIGFFVNTLVLRGEAEGNPSFHELLERTRRGVLDDAARQDLPFEKLVDALHPERDLGQTPLFQTMVVVQNAPRAELAVAGLELESRPADPGVAKTDLVLVVEEKGKGRLRAVLEYAAELFDRTTAERLAASWRELLAGAVRRSATRLGDLALLTAAERAELLAEARPPALETPQTAATFPALFAQIAAERPEAPAVDDGTSSLTYAELRDRASRLAGRLRRCGVAPEEPVGVALEPSLSFAVAFLAVLEAGAAWLPLDPAHPPVRRAGMLADAGAVRVLTREEEASRLELPETVETVLLDQDGEPAGAEPAGAADEMIGEMIDETIDPDRLAYVIFTSGSTGRPKATLLPHRGLPLLVAAQAAVLGGGGRVLQLASPGFDASIFELALALGTGGTLHLESRERLLSSEGLVRTLAERKITHLTITPSALAALDPAAARQLPELSTVMTAGEALGADLAAVWAPGRRLFNLYGPTEATIWTTFEPCTAGATTSERPAIGRPVPGTVAQVVDRHGQPAPPGVVGELWIGGPGLARGYGGQPARTAAVFVPDADAGEPGARLYKSGDRVRRRSAGHRDGLLDFLGRIDEQVKIRGMRVEPGEIAAALRRRSEVREAAVVAPAGRLVAFVVAAGGVAAGGELAEILRQGLRAELPESLVPGRIDVLDALPRTTAGKLDGVALERLAAEASQADGDRGDGPPAPPRTPLEHRLAALFEELLETPAGRDGDFFALGGHSLLAARLTDRLRRELGLEVPVRLLFEAPTVEGLARVIELLRRGVDPGHATPRRRRDLAAAGVLPAGIQPTGDVPGEPPRRVFLTGATGFLGAFLAAEILAREGTSLVCPVRAADVPAARERVRQNLERYGLWRDAFDERLEALPGDLEKPHLGLDAETSRRLVREVEAIVHNGARVSFLEPYETLRPANVDGTVEVLRLAAAERTVPVHHVSTLAVFAATRSGGTVAEDDPPAEPSAVENGYAQSKWVAERLVEAARARGIPATIYRPGRVTGSSRDGMGTTEDFFARMLKGSIQLGLLPRLDAPVDLTPVDWVARTIAALVFGEADVAAAGRNFHLVNPSPLTVEALARRLGERGFGVRLASFDAFRAALLDLDEAAARANALDPFLPLFLAPSLRLDAEPIEAGARPDAAGEDEAPRFASRATHAALGEALACPPADLRLLDAYLDDFLRRGFLEEATAAQA